jgi:hypothetical protein
MRTLQHVMHTRITAKVIALTPLYVLLCFEEVLQRSPQPPRPLAECCPDCACANTLEQEVLALPTAALSPAVLLHEGHLPVALVCVAYPKRGEGSYASTTWSTVEAAPPFLASSYPSHLHDSREEVNTTSLESIVSMIRKRLTALFVDVRALLGT